MKTKWYNYCILEYDITENNLKKFYDKNWYKKLFNYTWTNKHNPQYTKEKILLIKKL